jgi:class III poly(R)-hydroxyalkanoic acid synthase PhaE subunit
LLVSLLETALASWQTFTEATQAQRPGFQKSPPSMFEPWLTPAAFSQFFPQFPAAGPFPQGPFQGPALWPEMFQNLAPQWWTGYFTLQRLWQEHLAKVPPELQLAQVKHLDRDFFKNWLAAYEQTWQPLLQMPQLGLTRVYQEKIARLVDKFQIFQAALADFLFGLYQPVEESLATVQEHLRTQAQEGQVSDDFQVYYRMWIKILEGRYLTLFTEPDFLQAMKKTVTAMNDFMAARQEVVTATLKNLFIPTHEELDELYQEIYRLKKQVRELKSGQAKKKITKRSPSSK